MLSRERERERESGAVLVSLVYDQQDFSIRGKNKKRLTLYL